MNKDTEDKLLKELTALVADLFEVDACYSRNERLELSLRYRFRHNKVLPLLEDRLKLSGYEYRLDSDGETVLLSVSPKRRLVIPKLNIILFLATLVSVYVLPVLYFNLGAPTFEQAFEATLADLSRGRGLEFTIALVSILLVHEMAHFVASRRRGIITSWPYFIPAPNFIGTFGAIIKSKSPFWNRRDLIEVGAAGPIAGWIVALCWLVYGLSKSVVVTPGMAEATGLVFLLDGESILVRWLVPLLIGHAASGQFFLFSEAALAGWVGLLVTALNMLPIGQLDGGHVVYGLTRRRQAMLGWLAMGVLLVLGFQSAMWWVFAALGFIMGVAHPPTLNDNRAPSRAARILGWISLVILVLSFTPVPFQ